MIAEGGSTGPIWGLAGAVLALVGSMVKQRRDERMAKRLTSGSVETSDAQVLWNASLQTFKASEDLRHEMRDQIDRLLKELDQWTRRAEQWRTRVVDLEDENEELHNRLRKCEELHIVRPAGS